MTGHWIDDLDTDPELVAAGERFDQAMRDQPRGLSPAEIAAIYHDDTEEA